MSTQWRFWGTESSYLRRTQPLRAQNLPFALHCPLKASLAPFFLQQQMTFEHYIAVWNNLLEVLKYQALCDPCKIWPTKPYPIVIGISLVGNRVIDFPYSTAAWAGMGMPSYSPNLIPCDYLFSGHIHRHCFPKQTRNTAGAWRYNVWNMCAHCPIYVEALQRVYLILCLPFQCFVYPTSGVIDCFQRTIYRTHYCDLQVQCRLYMWMFKLLYQMLEGF